ncbi:flavodoxin [Enterococcus sp. 669A]|uniref:Flavodoxin n=1 Tax=Candidatus Enterococcus moelleringii TaxID=2815325 RepID=A0ABS3LCQ9_9ENTE|nr:flavodoxin [Enterococcus sp. 669A]MBO1307421.1 flavodoxin [Enterococcus sp. 669A]
MKKFLRAILMILVATGLTACSNDTESEVADGSDSGAASTNVELSENVLVAYFTEPEETGTDALAGASRVVEEGEVVGSTQFLAQTISEETGGELFRIETVQEYPADHDELVDQGDQEQSEDARPELTAEIENLADYDTIFVGYPNWFSDLPMPMYTFFESHDFAGKTIIPFSTHGGSGLSGTIETIGDLQPEATVYGNALSISRSEVADSRHEVVDWVNGI